MRSQPDMDDLPRCDWRCEECGASNDCFDADCQYCDGPDEGLCINGKPHSFVENCDELTHGEGRMYCEICGADGDA